MNRFTAQLRVRTQLHATVLVVLAMLLVACGSPGPSGAGGPPGAEATAPAAGPPGAEEVTAAPAEGAATEEPLPETGEPGVLTIWSYLPPDDPSVQAYIEAFKQQNAGTEIKYTAFPEDDFQNKIN